MANGVLPEVATESVDIAVVAVAVVVTADPDEALPFLIRFDDL